ncbi:unnamed protein product [Durusdinium trenchii]|uniref:BSD domain-containing protein n=1 Tax=Durusdinium trenchii TaxID=1381693 RepID=A0ABP0SZ38_9DINO
MQSFYGNFVAVPEGTAGGFCSGGSRSSSCPPARLGAVSTGGDRHSFYDSFWPKAKVAPPIFVSSVGRTESALALDRRLRACEAIPALVALLSELTHFDVGNVVIALSSGAKIVKVEQKVQESTEAKVAQGYLRTLDFKRWLTSVDPTGGCLEYLPAMQIHGTLEQIMETYLQASETTTSRILRDEFFTEHQVRQEHRIRFQRWFKDSCGAEEAQPCANPATLVTKEDTEIDLKRLSFSDWLASIDPSMALQQYLPCIQESYDTVSQIATTYTILKNGGQEKTLDLQLFDDFGVVDDEHQALFRNWFARFCGVREMADGDSLSTEDPSTPHFGPEGEVQTGTASNLPGNCSEEVKETATEVPSEKDAKVPAVALDAKMVQEEALSSPVKQLQREGHEANQQVEEVAQLVEAEHPPPGGQSPPQGNAFFDFDDLSAEPTLQKTELAENQARDGSGGMFDFDELEEIAPSAAGLKLPGDVAKEQVQEEVQAEDTKGQAVEEAGQDEQKEEMTEDTAKENDEADGNTKDDSKERIPEVEMEASNLLHQFDESIIPGNTDESGEQPAQNPETWGADVDHVETGRGGFFDFDDLDEAEAG